VDELPSFNDKMNITRNQAICMFFHVEYNEQNVAKFSKKIEDFEEVDICYENDPKVPVLVARTKIFSEPLNYKLYMASSNGVCSDKIGNGESN
jgi:hypothetical protein